MKTKKLICALLALIMALCAFPFCAHAEEEKPEFKRIIPSLKYAWIDDNTYYLGGNITYERSRDGVNWQKTYEKEDEGLPLYPKAKTYFRIKCDYLDDNNKVYKTAYSDIKSVMPDASRILSDDPDAVETNDFSSLQYKEELTWTIDKSLKSLLDGFEVYRSVNNGKFKKFKTVSIDKINHKDSSSFLYSINVAPIKRAAFCFKYRICPYYIDEDGVKHINTSVGGEETATFTDRFRFAKFKKMKNGLKVTVDKTVKAKEYKVKYWIYSKKTSKRIKKDSFVTGNKVFTIKGINPKKHNYRIIIYPSWDKFMPNCYMNYSTWQPDQFLSSLHRRKVNKIEVLNVRGKKSHKEKSIKLTKEDKRIIKRFIKKNYGKKDYIPAETAHEICGWIGWNVNVDSGEKNASKAAVKAALVDKLASPSQANLAMAKVFAYLGYKVTLVKGVHIYDGKETNLDWCEIQLLGEPCITDTRIGTGSFQLFCNSYQQYGCFYLINGSPAGEDNPDTDY